MSSISVRSRCVAVCAMLVSAFLNVAQARCQTAAAPDQAAVASRIAGPIDESARVVLKGTVHPLANAANDLGEAPESLPLERIHLALRRSDSQERALHQLVQDLHTPGSASYHKWLTPEQFGRQFGPSDEDIATVESWLQSHGFAVKQVNPGKQTIEFSGNAGQFRKTFHAAIHSYQAGGQTHYANAGDPDIPAALAPVVGGFVALNNFPVKHPISVLGNASYNPKTDKATPSWTYGTAAGYNFALAPGDYAVQYDLGPLYSAGINGTGQAIAVINPSNVNIDLVNQFRTLFNLPFNPVQVIIDGNDPGVDGINNFDGPNGWAVESYLDVEWSGAVAPNATIYLVTAADTALENGLFLAAEHAVYSNVAPIMSASVETCEKYFNGSNYLNLLWEQAAAQGITVVVASSDSGSAGCDDFDTQYYALDGLAVNGWASTPYDVAVGGTDFYYSDYANSSALGSQLATYWNTTPTQMPAVSLKGVIPEQPWNDSQFGLNAFNLYTSYGITSIAAGSGGASSSAVCSSGQFNSSDECTVPLTGYAKPSWQTGAGVPADSVRDLPDLSLFAANGVNYSYYPLCASDGDCQSPTGTNLVQITGVGGTSASAPAFAGVMALVNQKYGRQGQADFTLYPLKAQFPAAFHDVTQGTNSVPCNITTVVTQYYGTFPPLDCIAVANPVTVSDPTYGAATEGQIGAGTTADYNAAAGYNLATGLGTIDANQLVTNWGSIKFASTATTLTPSSTFFTEGTSITVSGTVTTASGTPTGGVALMTDSTEPDQQGRTVFTLNNGSFSGSVNNLPGGTYNIWGQYGGDAGNGPSASAKTQITVNPENSGVNLSVFAVNSSGLQTIASGTAGIPYGTELTLDANVTLSSGLSLSEPATGTITFKDGGTTLNTAVVNAVSEAGYTPPMSFNAGSHSITASYSGDNSYNPSAAAAIAFSVSQVTPSVFLAAPENTYTQGQASALTILVEGGQSGVAPTGTVTLTGAPSGTPATVTLSAGVDPATGNLAGLASAAIPSTAAAGSYTIGATYNPDSASSTNYTTASKSGFSLQINAASGIATTIVASASSGTTSPTAPVTVSGTVTAASGAAPIGFVYLEMGYVSGGRAAEAINAYATLTPGTGTSSTFSFVLSSQNLPQGETPFTVYYPGSSSDQPSATLISISNPFSDFTLIPQSAIVPVKAGGNATDTINLGSVNGFSGAVSLTCTAASGVTCTIPSSVSLTVGGSATATLTIGASASTSNGSYNVLIIGQNSTGAYIHTLGIQAVVTAPVPAATTGSASAITANSATLAGTVNPNGADTHVWFLYGASSILSGASQTPSQDLGSGTAASPVSANISGLNAGTKYYFQVVAQNSVGTTDGTINSFTTTSTTTTPTVTVTPSASSITTAQALTVTVAVSGGTGNPTPTGSVTLTSGTYTSAAATLSSGSATINVPAGSLAVGSDTLTATYTPDSSSSSTYNSATGSNTVTVTSAVAPSFTLAGTAVTIATPGAATGNTSTITVTPAGGFTGSVALTAQVTSSPAGAQDLPTLSFGSTTPVSITGASAGTAILTISTTAATSGALVYPERPGAKRRGVPWYAAGGATLACLLFFGIPARRRSWRAMLGMLALLVVLAGGAAACGGGGNNGGGGGGGGGGNSGTTPGAYTITVTGTSGTITETGTVALTVQ